MICWLGKSVRVKSYLNYLETEAEIREQLRVCKSGWNMTRKDQKMSKEFSPPPFLHEESRVKTSLYFHQLQS